MSKVNKCCELWLCNVRTNRIITGEGCWREPRQCPGCGGWHRVLFCSVLTFDGPIVYVSGVG